MIFVYILSKMTTLQNFSGLEKEIRGIYSNASIKRQTESEAVLRPDLGCGMLPLVVQTREM